MKVIKEPCHSCVISTCRLIGNYNKHNAKTVYVFDSVIFELSGKRYMLPELVQRIGDAVYGTRRDEHYHEDACFISSGAEHPTPFVRIEITSKDNRSATVEIPNNRLNPPDILKD